MLLPAKAESTQSKEKGESRAAAPLPLCSPGNTQLTVACANHRAGPDHMSHTFLNLSDFLTCRWARKPTHTHTHGSV